MSLPEPVILKIKTHFTSYRMSGMGRKLIYTTTEMMFPIGKVVLFRLGLALWNNNLKISNNMQIIYNGTMHCTCRFNDKWARTAKD